MLLWEEEADRVFPPVFPDAHVSSCSLEEDVTPAFCAHAFAEPVLCYVDLVGFFYGAEFDKIWCFYHCLSPVFVRTPVRTLFVIVCVCVRTILLVVGTRPFPPFPPRLGGGCQYACLLSYVLFQYLI